MIWADFTRFLFVELAFALEECVVGDGETVGFFVDASDEAGDMRILRKLDGLEILAGWDDDFDGGRLAVVAGFVATDDGDSGAVFDVFEEREDAGNLVFATVKNDEVGVGPVFMPEAASDDFLKGGGVVVLLFFELELAVFRAVRGAIRKNYHASDDVFPALVRDVVALDATRRLGQVEEFLELK